MQHSFIVKYQPLQIAHFEQLPPGLKQIITSLISIDNLNILINGPSGVGKTAIINAIVKQYYGNASAKTCEDNVLILNSLKEQGIQYYRNDLRIFSQTSSTINGRRKIIILDDIDTINDQSQQVFRNYIDKYRRNVHFIMACTNIQKVINSLQSRTIIIEIPSPTTKTLFQIATRIISNEPSIQKNIIRCCNNELCPLSHLPPSQPSQPTADELNLNLDLTCPLEYIISLSNNTIRTLINYLEKLYIFDEPFTIEVAKNMYTNISFAELERYTLHISKGELSEAIRVVYALYDHGYSVIDIIETYFTFLKTTQQITEKQKYKLVSLLCKYITVFHNIHEDEIELALFTNNAIREIVSSE
jgi:DNA polymerase III delta prime subunit